MGIFLLCGCIYSPLPLVPEPTRIGLNSFFQHREREYALAIEALPECDGASVTLNVPHVARNNGSTKRRYTMGLGTLKTLSHVTSSPWALVTLRAGASFTLVRRCASSASRLVRCALSTDAPTIWRTIEFFPIGSCHSFVSLSMPFHAVGFNKLHVFTRESFVPIE